eukprot:jgi/Chrzof1/4981/Cz15g07100.t1
MTGRRLFTDAAPHLDGCLQSSDITKAAAAGMRSSDTGLVSAMRSLNSHQDLPAMQFCTTTSSSQPITLPPLKSSVSDLESVVNDVEGASPMRRTRKQELMAYATGKAPGTISQAGMFLDVNAKAKQMV